MKAIAGRTPGSGDSKFAHTVVSSGSPRYSGVSTAWPSKEMVAVWVSQFQMLASFASMRSPWGGSWGSTSASTATSPGASARPGGTTVRPSSSVVPTSCTESTAAGAGARSGRVARSGWSVSKTRQKPHIPLT